jgi:hypothetical protein
VSKGGSQYAGSSYSRGSSKPNSPEANLNVYGETQNNSTRSHIEREKTLENDRKQVLSPSFYKGQNKTVLREVENHSEISNAKAEYAGTGPNASKNDFKVFDEMPLPEVNKRKILKPVGSIEEILKKTLKTHDYNLSSKPVNLNQEQDNCYFNVSTNVQEPIHQAEKSDTNLATFKKPKNYDL